MYREQLIRQYITDTFLFGDGAALRSDSSFMQEGIVDSTGILEVVNWLEEKFGIDIKDNELLPDNLDSIKNIQQFLELKAGPEPLSPESGE